MNHLILLGYDPRTFNCLVSEDVWENYQNFLIDPYTLDLMDDFKATRCDKHVGNREYLKLKCL